MAVITSTASKVSRSFPEKDLVFDFIAAETIAAGQPVYVNSAGRAALADASAAGTARVIGIALNAAGVGQAVSVLNRGHLEGFTLSGMAYDAAAYLSDTTGALDTVNGTVTVIVGRVWPLSDKALTKVLYIDCNNR
jgi:hypothetical protein